MGGDYRHDKQVRISSLTGIVFLARKGPSSARIVVVEAGNLRQAADLP